MHINTFPPHPELRSVIRQYVVVEADETVETVVLPHDGLVLALQFRGQVTSSGAETPGIIPPMALSGIRRSHRRFKYQARTGTVLILFTETGAFDFFDYPLTALFERVEPLESWLPRNSTAPFYEALLDARDDEQRIRRIDNFLLRHRKNRMADHVVVSALHDIRRHKGTDSIDSIARRLGVSMDSLEKRFRMATGASPKQFSLIIRLKQLVASRRPSSSLTELAYDYAFYDQSHFVRQFKRFTGQPPREFFKMPYPW